MYNKLMKRKLKSQQRMSIRSILGVGPIGIFIYFKTYLNVSLYECFWFFILVFWIYRIDEYLKIAGKELNCSSLVLFRSSCALGSLSMALTRVWICFPILYTWIVCPIRSSKESRIASLNEHKYHTCTHISISRKFWTRTWSVGILIYCLEIHVLFLLLPPYVSAPLWILQSSLYFHLKSHLIDSNTHEWFKVNPQPFGL